MCKNLKTNPDMIIPLIDNASISKRSRRSIAVPNAREGVYLPFKKLFHQPKFRMWCTTNSAVIAVPSHSYSSCPTIISAIKIRRFVNVGNAAFKRKRGVADNWRTRISQIIAKHPDLSVLFPLTEPTKSAFGSISSSTRFIESFPFL